MEMPTIDTSDALGLARENYRLTLENNEMLKKMDQRYKRGFWMKIVWFIVLFVLPLLLLPYFMNSYLATLGLSTGMGGLMAPGAESNAQQVLDLLQNNHPNPR